MKPRGDLILSENSGSETHTITPSGGTPYVAYQGYPIVSSSGRSFEGFDISRFHHRKKSGELLPYTSFHQFEHSASRSGSYHLTRSNGQTHVTPSDWSGNGSVAFEIGKAECLAKAAGYPTDAYLTASAAKIYAQGHDSLTFLAELPKTISMFRNIQNSLTKLLRGKDLLSSWLEYRYGWRTLYYDIVDIAEAINNIDSTRQRFTQSVGADFSDVSVVDTNYSDSYQSWTVRSTTTWDIGVRGMITADLDPPKFRINPITTGWELVRFSFIIDWIIDIGSWLESLSFLVISQNYTAAAGYKITARREVLVLDAVGKSGNTLTASFNSSAFAELKLRVPQTVPKLPSINVSLDIPKIVDILAILDGFKAKRN